MASSSLTLNNLADVGVVFTLSGQSSDGALYKVATRSLSLPETLQFQYQLGSPGSLGNDKLIVTIADTTQNATTAKIVTTRLRMEVSVPRDAAATATTVNDLMAILASLLSDARLQNITAAVVP